MIIDDNPIGLTHEMMVEDYEYLWKDLKENYPYFNVAKREGTDLERIEKEYRNILNTVKTDLEFYKFLLSLNDALTKNGPIGHLSMLNYNEYKTSVKSYENVDGMKSWNLLLNNTTSQTNYPLFDKMLQKSSNGILQILRPRPSLNTSIIEENEIAYLEIPSFDISLVEKDGKKIKSFYESISGYKHLIIDLRGNPGGSSLYYIENIFKPLCDKNRRIYSDEYMLFMGGTRTMSFLNSMDARQNLKPISELPEFENINKDDLSIMNYYWLDNLLLFKPDKNDPLYNGTIWILLDENCYSATESFAYFCKKERFGILVGTPTGGDGIGFDPILVSLPNSGIIFRYSCHYGLNLDGSSNEESGTTPHIQISKDQDALEVCIKAIKNSQRV